MRWPWKSSLIMGSDYDSDHDDEWACQRSRVIWAIDAQPVEGARDPLRAEELDMLVCFRLTPEFDLWTKFEQSSKCLRSSSPRVCMWWVMSLWDSIRSIAIDHPVVFELRTGPAKLWTPLGTAALFSRCSSKFCSESQLRACVRALGASLHLEENFIS